MFASRRTVPRSRYRRQSHECTVLTSSHFLLHLCITISTALKSHTLVATNLLQLDLLHDTLSLPLIITTTLLTPHLSLLLLLLVLRTGLLGSNSLLRARRLRRSGVFLRAGSSLLGRLRGCCSSGSRRVGGSGNVLLLPAVQSVLDGFGGAFREAFCGATG